MLSHMVTEYLVSFENLKPNGLPLCFHLASLLSINYVPQP